MLHREKPSWGVHSICGPWPRNSNLVTVEQGTFHHSSTLPAISMDFQKKKKTKKKTKQLTPSPRSSSHDQPEWGATGHRPTPRQPFPRYYIHQFVSISPLAFPNHHLYNLLPFDTRTRNEGAVQPTPQGEHDQTK